MLDDAGAVQLLGSDAGEQGYHPFAGDLRVVADQMKHQPLLQGEQAGGHISGRALHHEKALIHAAPDDLHVQRMPTAAPRLASRRVVAPPGRDQIPRLPLGLDIDAALARVQPIIEGVRTRGVDALDEYAETFDGIRLPALRVPADVMRDALTGLDPDVLAALTESIRRARLVHRDQQRAENTTVLGPGAPSSNGGYRSSGSGS